MGLKELFLNKGWAGKTLSRQETVERINPLLRTHYELNRAYEYAIRNLSDAETADRLEVLQKTARGDVGKLSETVLSAGGVAYNGTDLEPGDVDLGSNDASILGELERLESALAAALDEELEEEHQIRTRAILGVVRNNSRERLDYVRRAARNAQ
ncbi:MAG: hypothetical protein WD021_09885 [Rhodothermales bacterium]